MIYIEYILLFLWRRYCINKSNGIESLAPELWVRITNLLMIKNMVDIYFGTPRDQRASQPVTGYEVIRVGQHIAIYSDHMTNHRHLFACNALKIE